MAHRFLATGGLLALALAAAGCSGSEPAAEDAGASETATVAAPEAAVPLASADTAAEVPATEEAPAEEAEPAEVAAKAAPTPAPAPVPAKAAAPAAEVVKVAEVSTPASYGRCAVCHTANKGGEDKLGPNLYGVFGSAAAQGGFAYSDALKDAGLVWDEATMDKWLENPRKMVPGNRMSFPGLKDAAKRKEIIDFLKQQR